MVLMLMREHAQFILTRRKLAVQSYGQAIGAKYLDVYIFSIDKPVVRADGKLSLVNQSPEKDIARGQLFVCLLGLTLPSDIVAGFDENMSWWSFFSLAKSNELKDEKHGFVKNGWFTVRVHLSIKDQPTLPNPQKTELDRKSVV